MSEELCFMSATELVARIRRGDVSPVEIVDALLARIDEFDGEINAYTTVIEEQARRAAQQAERAVTAGDRVGPLHGVPIALKDLLDFKVGVRHTFGSRPFADFVPQWDATCVQRLENAGAIVLGKTNTSEFGHKGTTDNLLCGPTSTPFAPGKNAGGSSGGSAAAVAAGLATVAQGGDGGGSIRIPASFCGVYGLKASFGRVAAASRPNGFFSHTPFIHSGPLTRTVEDAALMLRVTAGPHPRDPLSLPDDGIDYKAAIGRSIADLKIAYSPNLDVFPVDARVEAVVAEAIAAFAEAGAIVEEAGPGLKHSQEELCDLWIREVAVSYAELDAGFKKGGVDLLGEHTNELAPEFVELIELGQSLSAVDYKLDDVVRTEVLDALENVFETYDLLVTPTLAVPPFDNACDGNTVGPSEVNGETVNPLIGWCLTYPFNFIGHPAASIPAGFTPEGLPIGLQIVGRRFADDTVLAASAAFERVRPWCNTYPPAPHGT